MCDLMQCFDVTYFNYLDTLHCVIRALWCLRDEYIRVHVRFSHFSLDVNPISIFLSKVRYVTYKLKKRVDIY